MSARVVAITLTGEMDRVSREAFDDVAITSARGVTHLRFVRRGPSMLHGVLARIEALGLEVLDVHTADGDEPITRPPPQR